jgi:ribonuclease HI
VYYDRAWRSTEAGATAILISSSGIQLRYAARLQFTTEIDKCINNKAKYEAVLLGLHKLRAMGV